MAEPSFSTVDLADLQIDAPPDSIISRTVHDGPDVKVVVFGFAPGQSLSEHTAARPALLHLLSGKAIVTLADERIDAEPGFWAHMDAGLPHAVQALEHSTLLLVLLGHG